MTTQEVRDLAGWVLTAAGDTGLGQDVEAALLRYAELLEAAGELLRLREPSLLRNDAPRHEVQREMERAWERLRRAVRGAPMTTPPLAGPAPERVPDDAWWVLEPMPGYVRVTLPQESLVMPVDQIRRFASQLAMAADAAGTGIAPTNEEGK